MRIEWRPRRLEVIVVATLIIGLWFLLLFGFARARDTKRGQLCQSNLKEVGLAMMQYTRDYDEMYPLGSSWSEILYPYCKKTSIFHCPSATEFGYSLNSRLVGLSMNDVSDPATAPLVFESSVLKEFQHDAGKSWLTEPRHPQGIGLVYNDGRAHWRQQPPQFPALPRPK